MPGEGCTIETAVTVASSSTCTVAVSPSQARVGETVRIEAAGLTANGDGLGLSAIRQDGESAALFFGPDGTFTRTFVAGRWMVGDHEVRILDTVSGCRAQIVLTVVP
jgi:fructose-1-phosphate kinase PfkB-like protein